MRRSSRTDPPSAGRWYESSLYDVWPTKIEDTVQGLFLAADLFERDGDPDKARNIRAGVKAFEGRGGRRC